MNAAGEAGKRDRERLTAQYGGPWSAHGAAARGRLTVTDLHDTLADERHLGWGYACLDVLSDSKRERIDRAIVAVANEEGLTRDELFTWSNSKHGRWLADMVYGRGMPASRATVRKQLSREIIDSLVAEESR